jgi:hypothetical protein
MYHIPRTVPGTLTHSTPICSHSTPLASLLTYLIGAMMEKQTIRKRLLDANSLQVNGRTRSPMGTVVGVGLRIRCVTVLRIRCITVLTMRIMRVWASAYHDGLVCSV